MRELLRVAANESQDKLYARVHAINTLRLIFNDKNLANDVSGFFAEGTLESMLSCLSRLCYQVLNAERIAVLCCAVLCCAVLCCAVLCCAVLCCAVLCCAVLCCAVLCSAAVLRSGVLLCSALL